VDQPLQPGGPAQRLGDAVASRVLCGVVSQKQDSTCPKLGGAVHSFLTFVMATSHLSRGK
jgi:hypothetical protein